MANAIKKSHLVKLQSLHNHKPSANEHGFSSEDAFKSLANENALSSGQMLWEQKRSEKPIKTGSKISPTENGFKCNNFEEKLKKNGPGNKFLALT